MQNGVSSLSDDFPCKHCEALVYWGPGWLADGTESRRLFSTETKRPHDCKTKPNADAFDEVAE